MQLREEPQCVGDGLVGAIAMIRMETSTFVLVDQQHFIRDCEQRAFQRGEDAQLVVRPLDGGERGPQSFHFLAVVERFRPRQQVIDVARLQCPRVLASEILAALGAPAEQDRDIPAP